MQTLTRSSISTAAIAATLLFALSPLQAADSSTQIRVKASVSESAEGEAESNTATEGRAAGRLLAPGGRAGKCCEKPAPFPGLYCCDTRDCGWFDCDAEISGEPKKQFR